MQIVSFIWIFTVLGRLQTLNISKNEGFSEVRNWGIKETEIVQGREQIRKKFESSSPVSCEDLNKTEETPFVAIVLFMESGRLLCMGSIIDKLHILTARRCYTKADPSDLRVLAGCLKAYWGKDSEIRKVRRIIRHEYEIAMLRLSSPFTFSSAISPINVPRDFTAMITEFKDVYGGPYKIAGFNVDRFDVPGDYVQKTKRYKFVTHTLLGFGPCLQNLSKVEVLKDFSFCTNGEESFCWGGLGGPVTVYLKAKAAYLQVGVVVADNCTAQNTGPYLCARTDSFSDWIIGNAHQGHQPQ